MYSVTYVPVLVNMMECSPYEQMLYEQSGSQYMVPPQQYSVYPTGFSSCYAEPNMNPEYGIPYYTDQTMYNQSPYTMVPPLQQSLLAIRERKTIRVRDPNQGSKDVTEDIMLEVGWSRNPTPHSFIHTPPPLQLNHGVEHDCVFNLDRVQVLPAPVDLKPEKSRYMSATDDKPKLEGYALKCVALEAAEMPTSPAEPSAAQAVTPEPVQAPAEVQASAAQVLNGIDGPAETDTAPPPDDPQLLREDKPEPAFQQSEFDLEPVSTTVENSRVSSVTVEHGDSAETSAEVNGEQEAESLMNEPGPSSEEESNDGVLSPAEEPNSNTVHKPELMCGRRQYSRDFLLNLQFVAASVQKPESLPNIFAVVLAKMKQNKVPLLPDPKRLISRNSDFTPTFADYNSSIPEEKRAPPPNASLRRPPSCKFTANMLMNDEVQLKKAENAWKPCMKRDKATEDNEAQKTEELFRRVRSILNKLTPQMFNHLMNQVKELSIDTEERLKGVIDLVFEKAIDEPNFAVGYGIMCKCLATLQVPMADKPDSAVNFRRLLLNHCQKEFEKDKTTNDVIEKKQLELGAATSASERERLEEELKEAKSKSRRRTTGNIKFVGELFKLRMLNEATMHDCVNKLLKNNDEECLECLSILLTTVGKELDMDKSKARMDMYLKQIGKIVKERKTSSRVRFMLQDVIDLRLNNWVSRRVKQGPKTIEQIHIDAKIEEQEEQRKVYEQLRSMGKRRPAMSTPETMNTVSRNNTMDPNKIPKFNKSAADNMVYLGSCLGQGQMTWKNGCRGGNGGKAGKSDISRPSRTKASATASSSTNVPDTPKLHPSTESRSPLECSQSSDYVKLHGSMSNKPALTEEEMEKRSRSIIKEFLHLNDYKEAVQCVEELDQATMLYVFVRLGVETTLERSQVTRDHMGQLFHQLLQAGSLSKSQFLKGFSETLEVAGDMAIDIPHIWLYIAELVNPVLREGGISLRELFSEFSKPLLPVAKAGILFAEIMHLLCKQMSQNKVKALWRDSGLSWTDFLPETEDVHSFINKQKLGFTLSECSSPEELKAFSVEKASKDPSVQQGDSGSTHIRDCLLPVSTSVCEGGGEQIVST